MIRVPEDISMVVLDLDGTIYRKPKMTWYMLRKQWCHLPSLLSERLFRRHQRKAIANGQQLTAGGQAVTASSWYSENYLTSMVEIIREHYQLQEWVRPLLAECKQRGIRLIILSDYEAAEDKLSALGLAPEAFDAVLSTGDLGTIKPDSRLGEMIADKMNNAAIDWRHVLFIGDRDDTDGLLAKALHAQYVHV